MSKAQSDVERQMKEREKQRRHNQHQQNWERAARQIEEEKQRHLERLMKTDMTDAGINLLDNMVDRSFILGNINEAEYHDIKWELRGMYKKIKSAFPPDGSEVTGEIRAYIKDDKDENLEPLSSQQRIIIVQMIRGVMMLVSRSKDGFQQEMNVKSISVSEVMDNEEQTDDKLLKGLFGG